LECGSPMPLYINVKQPMVSHRAHRVVPLFADGCFALDEGSFLADDLAMIAERFPALKNPSTDEKLILVARHRVLASR
jgi:hypothetical protein